MLVFISEFTVPAVADSTGKMMSETVTVALQVLLFPAASFTVITTVFEPLFVQLKLVLLSVIIKLPDAVQLSLDPSFTSLAVKVAIPDEFKYMVAALQTAVGGVLSATVTVNEHELSLSAASFTV
jgi:hypothetical protein